MTAPADSSDLSELERELELEMEGDPDSLGELGDDVNAEFDEELDGPPDGDGGELEIGTAGSDYSERLAEIASREFESESEVDSALGEVLNDIEREYFFGALKRGWKKLKRGPLGALAKKGLSLAAGQFPALQVLKGFTGLARGNLKGMLSSLAKAGIASAVPGGGAALGALKSLGFGESELGTGDHEAWDRLVDVAHESYQHLLESVTERANDPVEAARLAADALKTGLARAQRGRSSSSAGSGPGGRRKRRIRLRRGDVLIVECE
jgi:hypothetical protein